MSKSNSEGLGFLLLLLTFWVGSIAAWITHVFWLFTALMRVTPPATAGEAILGILGVFVPPIGILHGIYIWFT